MGKTKNRITRWMLMYFFASMFIILCLHSIAMAVLVKRWEFLLEQNIALSNIWASRIFKQWMGLLVIVLALGCFFMYIGVRIFLDWIYGECEMRNAKCEMSDKK